VDAFPLAVSAPEVNTAKPPDAMEAPEGFE
jgi:hypothetical protein